MKGIITWFVFVACLTPTLLVEARYYDPKTGRFLQQDPEVPGQARIQRGRAGIIQPSAFIDTQSLNSYVYVTNNPVLVTDPFGELSRLDPRWLIARDKVRSELRARLAGKFTNAEIERASTIFADKLQPTQIPKVTSGNPQLTEEALTEIFKDARNEAVRKGRTEDINLLDRLAEEAQKQKAREACPPAPRL